MMMRPNLNVILAHDWLTGMRGGERVLETLCQTFPAARIYSLIHNPSSISPTINQHPIFTSYLQKVPGILRHYRYWLPFFPAAMEKMQMPPADALISISHCVAKGARPAAGTRHLCYCLTPMRYAWLFYEEYFGHNPLKKALLKPCLARLRAWDAASAQRVHRFVTISQHVRRRIQQFYGRDADVVYPPINTAYWTPPADRSSPPPPVRETYDLIASALVPYKRVDLAVKAYTRSGTPLVVVGSGPETPRLRQLAGPNIRFLGWITDEQLRQLYRHCRALIFPGQEDFGIVPLEAQACGRPVVAFGKGGALETVVDGVTGLFFQEQSVEALLEAVERCASQDWDASAIRAHAELFSPERFLSGISHSLALCLGEESSQFPAS